MPFAHVSTVSLLESAREAQATLLNEYTSHRSEARRERRSDKCNAVTLLSNDSNPSQYRKFTSFHAIFSCREGSFIPIWLQFSGIEGE